MRKYLRQLMPGQQFTLLRTGEKYRLVRRVISTPSGTRFVVIRDDPYITAKDGQQLETSLHHACHVWVNEEKQPC